MARRRPILLAVVLASLATTAATGAGAGAGQETPLVAPAPLRAGDPAALRELWWSILESEPGSLESYWILQHWQQFLALEAKRPAERERWSRLRARLDDNGWTHRLAGWLLHEELLREGDLGAAEELGMTVGSPRRWIGVGPFGRHRATGLHRLFSPEKGFAGGASHEGTHGAVTWRPLEAPPRDTRLRPREQFSRQGAIYFLRARFGVEAAVEGILQAASGGSFRLFLDGKELFVVDRHRDALPQVARSGVRLGAGGHTILVKGDGAPISVLLRDVRGFPIPVADLDPWEEEVRDGGAESLPSLAPVGLPGAEWGAAWERGDLLPRLWLPLALLWASEGDAVACEEVLRAAEEQGLDPVALALTATRCADVLFYLPSAWKRNWLESLWERALASDPELVPVLLAVAEERYREDRIEEALPMIERVLEIQPRSLAAHLLREEIAGDRRWRRERLEALARLLELAPRHPRVLSLAIRRWSGEGRPDKALPLREALFGLRPRLAAGRELAIAYRSMGRVEEALGVVERLREVTGASIDFLNMERSLLERWGMHDRALQVIEELGRRIPQSAALHADRGEILWKQGRVEEAAEAYRLAASISPGRIDLARRIEFLEGGGPQGTYRERSFWEPYQVSLEEALASAPEEGAYPKAGAVYVLDQMVSRVRSDGGVEEMIHQIIRLDSQQAVEEMSELPVPGEILELRVLTPEGVELHPTAGGGRGRYTLPGLTPGSVIEARSILRTDLSRPRDLDLGPFYFQDPELQNAFHRSEWVVLLPEAWKPVIREKGGAPGRSERVVEGTRELIWRVQGSPTPEPEFLSPPASEILPNVWVHGERRWSEALEAVAASTVVQDFATAALEEAARDILDGIEGRRARVEALYNAVCERVKTPGAGTTPAEIWLEKSGDRDLLLAGLLRAAGIPFQRVMAADKDALQPHVDWEQPNPSLFHFPLFRVPLEGEEQLFITTRYRLASPGRIPLSIQGARGVLAGMAAGRWLQLPSAPPEDESQALEATIDLDQADGGVHLVGRVETRRLQGSLMKEQVRSLNPFVRTTMVERFVQEIFPGARIRSGDFPDLDARGTPFLFTFDIDAPGLLQVEEGSPTLRSILTPAHLVRAFVRGASRTYPMQSRAESLVTERNVIRLGEAYQVEQLPADLLLDGPWGSYRLTFRGAGGEITIERRLELRPFRAEPEALGDLIDFCTRIDRKEEERIRLRRTGNDGGE